MVMARNLTSRLTEDRSGSAILELAVLLPILFTIGFGVIEFGNMIYQYHLITVGVRDAARYLSGTGQSAAITTAAQNIAATGVVSGGTNRVSWWNPDDVDVFYTDVANDDGTGNKLYRGGPQIRIVRVSTSISYQSLGLLGYLGLGPITLMAQHDERVVGVR